jgi:nitroreductase
MELLEAIKGRRSVRAFTSDPVPGDVVKQLLEAVQWAPSWANTQCWEIILIRDASTKEKLADTLSAGNPARKSMMEAASSAVFLGTKGRSGFKQGEPCTDKGDWYMFDVGLAVQNFCLAAHDLGLGTVIIGYFDAVRAGEILSVPREKAVVAIVPFGNPEKVPTPPKRKALGDFVYEGGYGKPWMG